MASRCLRVPSGCWACSSQGTVSSSIPASVLVGGGNGVRSVAALGASVGSSSIRSNSRRRRGSFCVRAGIRAVESYDASFQLQPEADEKLQKALSSEVFCSQVTEQSKKGAGVKYEFTGELFQPVPWSPTTKFGMPVEFERYLQDKENFVIINVPPNFMFNSKIFKPSRLCAVYKRV